VDRFTSIQDKIDLRPVLHVGLSASTFHQQKRTIFRVCIFLKIFFACLQRKNGPLLFHLAWHTDRASCTLLQDCHKLGIVAEIFLQEGDECFDKVLKYTYYTHPRLQIAHGRRICATF